MKYFRFLLFPISCLFWIITEIRNLLYDADIAKSSNHKVKIISVGNLSVGGTGKSPMILYLFDLLSKKSSIAILSRGYGRKTKGFRVVENDSISSEVGDEPLMFKLIGKESVKVAVCENRNNGINNLEKLHSNIDLVLLDDAFQHRRTKAGMSILLTTFENPFYSDFILPMGNLRESRKEARRADIIIVTKCPKEFSNSQKDDILRKLAIYNKPIFFSKIIYSQLVSFQGTKERKGQIKQVLVVAGIADPADMIAHLSANFNVDSILFSDHHEFTRSDIEKIHRKFDTFAPSEKVIVTTLKDYMRLNEKVNNWGLDAYPWYFLPISVQIDKDEEFNRLIKDYVG